MFRRPVTWLAIACALIVVVWIAASRDRPKLSRPPDATRIPEWRAEDQIRRPESREREEPTSEPSDGAPFISGIVLDQDDHPAPGAEVMVATRESAVLGSSRTGLTINDDEWSGYKLVTDGGGRFSARLDRIEEVTLLSLGGPGFSRVTDGGAFRVTPPVSGVILRVRRYAMARLSIRLYRSTGETVERFRVGVKAPGLTALQSAESAVASFVVPFREPATPVSVRCEIVDPPAPRPLVKSIDLAPGDDVALDFWLDAAEKTLGRVVDHEQRPVPGAIVFFGEARVLRSDVFGPPDARRATGAVKTDDHGRFELEGSLPRVTAWIEGRSATTLDRAPVMLLVLPPCGSIAGELSDSSGAPLRGGTVKLDKRLSGATDEQGRFRFDGLIAGGHILVLPDGALRLIEVRPGETSLVTTAGLTVDATIAVAGLRPPTGRAMLVGRGGARALIPIELSEGSADVKGVPVGSYWLATAGGTIVGVSIERSGLLNVAAGSSDLSIEGRARVEVDVIPAEAEAVAVPFLREVGNASTGDDGRCVVAPLPAGDYDVWTGGRRQRVRVERGSSVRVR
jgi:hypothetical protein